MRMLLLNILLVAILAFLVKKAMQTRRPSRKNSAHEPRCGHCGYIVRGISGLFCPECGRDLRECGITTGRCSSHPAWTTSLVLAIGWTVLLYVTMPLPVELLRAVVPAQTRVSLAARLDWPQSKAYRSVSISGSDICRMDAANLASLVPDRTLRLLTSSGQVSTLDVNLSTGAYSYAVAKGPNIRASDSFATPGVMAWLKAAGVDTAHPSLADEAVEIVAAARCFPPHASFLQGGASSASGGVRGFSQFSQDWSANSLPWPWLRPAANLVWFLLWLAGVGLIVLRCKPDPLVAKQGS